MLRLFSMLFNGNWLMNRKSTSFITPWLSNIPLNKLLIPFNYFAHLGGKVMSSLLAKLEKWDFTALQECFVQNLINVVTMLHLLKVANADCYTWYEINATFVKVSQIYNLLVDHDENINRNQLKFSTILKLLVSPWVKLFW